MVGRTPCARLLKQPRPFPSAQSLSPTQYHMEFPDYDWELLFPVTIN